MSRSAITEHMADRVAHSISPGYRAKLSYRIAQDDFVMIVRHGEEFTRISLQSNELMLSLDDFKELLKTKLPPEWLRKAAKP